MAMRTQVQILADRAISNTIVEDEKLSCPMNYNIFLLLEVLLNIRTYLKRIEDDQEDVLAKLEEIRVLLAA